MTGETESQPEETRARGEASEGREDREEQSLEDATLDPGVLIEQSGEYQQAEAIMSNFIAVEEATTPETIPTMEEVFPMEAEEPATNSEESEETSGGNAEQGEDISQGRGIIVETEINSPPEKEQTEADTESESEGVVVMSAIPLEVPVSGDTTGTEAEETGSASKEREESYNGGSREGREIRGEQGVIAEVEIISSPEGGQEEGARSESGGVGVVSAIPLDRAGNPVTTDTRGAESETQGQIDQALEGG
jgi:hypothetical protein